MLRCVTGIPASFWSGNRGRHPWHDLDRNAGTGQHEHLFRTPSKHERVSALEAHDVLALPRRTNHQAIDRLLLDAGAPGSFPDTETLRPGETTKRLGVDECVVQDEIGFLDATQCAKRPQFRVTGTRADQADST